MLSGFLITTRYVDRVTPNWEWAKHYMFNRFARIYPLYLLLTIAAFVAMPLRHTYAWYEWQAHARPRQSSFSADKPDPDPCLFRFLCFPRGPYGLVADYRRMLLYLCPVFTLGAS